ncbi:hypothetical protein, partial [Neisseria gonorrhoeae]|uniref:hypothetical protein n=1 Tax=Neisseria gonorrhoeae TaxID=485 RepID=UPI001BC91D7D
HPHTVCIRANPWLWTSCRRFANNISNAPKPVTTKPETKQISHGCGKGGCQKDAGQDGWNSFHIIVFP